LAPLSIDEKEVRIMQFFIFLGLRKSLRGRPSRRGMIITIEIHLKAGKNNASKSALLTIYEAYVCKS
jgi:hypothetical protein